jgi:hypothetical protein
MGYDSRLSMDRIEAAEGDGRLGRLAEYFHARAVQCHGPEGSPPVTADDFRALVALTMAVAECGPTAPEGGPMAPEPGRSAADGVRHYLVPLGPNFGAVLVLDARALAQLSRYHRELVAAVRGESGLAHLAYEDRAGLARCFLRSAWPAELLPPAGQAYQLAPRGCVPGPGDTATVRFPRVLVEPGGVRFSAQDVRSREPLFSGLLPWALFGLGAAYPGPPSD